MADSFDSVLLIGYGGPEKPEDIRPFLADVLRGKPVPPERIEEVAHHYEQVGGRSPFNELTQRQAAALQARLAETGYSLPVRLGTRHWHPRLVDTLREMAANGLRRAAGVIMAPHRCRSSFEQYIDNVADARARIGHEAPEVEFIAPWFDHPHFIAAAADGVATCLDAVPATERDTTELLFCAHSIPTRMAENSPYVEQIMTTSRLVAEKVGFDRWSLNYQSRSGRPEDPWLEPDICDALTERAKQGLRHAIVVPIGFLCDHVEVLFDLDIEAAERARELGLTMHRAPTVGDHPKFIETLAERVRALLTH